MNVEKAVWVPIFIQNVRNKLPFILFIGWTAAERRTFAEELRKLKAYYEAKKTSFNTLCGVSLRAAAAGAMSEEAAEMLQMFFANSIQSARLSDFAHDGCDKREVRIRWLETQINMIDVKDEVWHT